MINYIILFSLTTFFGLLISKLQNGIQSNSTQKRINFYYFIAFLIYVLFVGCRDVTVGSDSSVYEYKFDLAKYGSLPVYLASTFFSDVGFYIFTWSIRQLTDSVNIYFIIISIIYFGIFLRFIREYSDNPVWSFWLLSSLGFTTFAMSTLRQSLAISFCLACYMCYLKQKKIYIFFLLLAISFHSSSIIFLSLFFVKFLLRSKRPWKIGIIMFLTVISAPYVMSDLMRNINEGFYEETKVGGVGMILLLLFLIFIGAITLFPKRKENSDEIYYEFVLICFAFCSFIVTRFNLAAMRLFYYFLAFAVVYIPNVLLRSKSQYRFILSAVLILLSFYYLSMRVMDSPYEESRLLLPYSFFWEK